MQGGNRGSRVHRAGAVLGGVSLIAALLVGPTVAGAAGVVVDDHTLQATLDPNNLGDGDPGASGSVAMALDSSGGQACFDIAVTLTDLAGDPPTLIDVHDQTTGDPGDVVLTLTTSVDGTGSASGCVAADAALLDAMLGAPRNYVVLVTTAGFPDGAVKGMFEWSYPATILAVTTLICSPAIQSPAQLPPTGADHCDSVVLPKDDFAPFLPPGYTVIGYGGTKVFDYEVNDGRNIDATTASADRGGGGFCNPTTMTCNVGPLPYEWNPIGAGPTTITPTLIPAGYRFGAATAADCCDANHVIPFSIDAQNVMTVDSSGTDATDVFVYLFASSDTTAPSVSHPAVSFASGGVVSSVLPIHLSWTGHDTGSGIDHYQLQRSRDGGSWTTLYAALHAPQARTSMSLGHTYRFRVRAIDVAGNVGAWGYSSIQRPLAYQDTSSKVTYHGTWHATHVSTAYGGTLHGSVSTGSTASLTFTGRAVAWVAPLGSTRGSARVYFDGHLLATVDLHHPAAARIVVFSTRWASKGTHTITVKVVGTAGHPQVDIDAFLVLD